MVDPSIKGTFLILLFIIGSLSIIPSAADVLPPTGPEMQGITSHTLVSVNGHFSTRSGIGWVVSSEVVGANAYKGPGGYEYAPEPPLSDLWEVQMCAAYSEDTLAQEGRMEYGKESAVETTPLPASGYNIENTRIFDYSGSNGGQVFSTEEIMLAGYGTDGIDVTESMSCAFSSGCGCTCFPAFCTQAQAGSRIDMEKVSSSSSAKLRNVNEKGGGETDYWPPIPGARDPARVVYGIRINEVATAEPSVGSVSAFADVNSREGGAVCPVGDLPFVEITAAERRSVDGSISLFSYDIDYTSGVNR